MKASSLKTKLQKFLIKEGYRKSEKVKNSAFANYSAGFTFEKLGDAYFLYFSSGNMVFKGMSTEEKDVKTLKMYNHIISVYGDQNIELVDLRDYKAISLKV